MLRRMFALVALFSLLGLAACGSDIAGVQETDSQLDQGSADRVPQELSEDKAELEEPPGGGGGGVPPAPVTADQNQRRRNRQELAP